MESNLALYLGISLGTVAMIGLLGLLAWSLVWVYRDAEARGKSGWVVALLVLFLKWPLSLLLWIAFRPQELLVEGALNGMPRKPL